MTEKETWEKLEKRLFEGLEIKDDDCAEKNDSVNFDEK